MVQPQPDRRSLRIYAQRVASWVMLRYEASTLLAGVVIGLVVACAAGMAVDGPIATDFYAVAVQTFPVFLIALAVEQRLVNRLGMSESDYVQRAMRMLELAWVSQLERGLTSDHLEMATEWDSNPEFHWVKRLADEVAEPDLADRPADARVERDDMPGIEEQLHARFVVERDARRRYSTVRRAQLVWIAGAVLLLLVGFIAALSGLMSGSASPSCAVFWLTSGTLPATFTLVAFGALRDLVEDIATA